MTRRTVYQLGVVALVAAIAVALAILWQGHHRDEAHRTKIRYGISPFQDTAIPVLADSLGLYKENGLDVNLVTLAWEDITPSLASAGPTVDVAIGSTNLLLPRAENINLQGGGDLVFYFPFYVFKGAALMVHGDSGLSSLDELLKKYPNDRNRAIAETVRQLRGKKVGVPKGTPYEQMLLAALRIAGMDPQKDIDIRYVKLADGLPAFLSGDLDAVGAGVTQRTEAMRHGAKVLFEMENMGFAEIDGLMTTKHFAEAHPEELHKLVHIWFQTVDRLMGDVDTNAKPVLDYLTRTASTKYSLDEFKTALTYQVFPRSLNEAHALMLKPSGTFYWKRIWDNVNDYQLQTGQAKARIPYDYFWGERVFQELKP